jgi:ABC-type branched-subunit amino acid transport system substrate-binding protein
MHAMNTLSHPVGRRLLQLLPALALAGTAPRGWAAETGVSASEIVIGQSITLQGGKNVYGSEALAGVKAYVDAANRNGGVNGRRIVLRTLDDENSTAKAEANARALVQQGVFVLFGSIEGGPSTAVMKAAVELGVPFIGPMAGSPGLRLPHQPLVYPVRAEHREEFRALVNQGRRIGLQRVALFHADSDIGREHLANVQKLAAEAGMAFGGGLPFTGDISDAHLAAAVATLTQKNIDLVINHGSAAVYARLIRTARAAGSRTTFWGVNSGSTPLAAELGPLAKGMVFAQIVPNPNSGKTALVREYQERLTRTAPGQPYSYGSLEGYMTAKALAAALRAAGTSPTRASLVAALERFETDLGGITLRWRKGEHVGSSFVDLALVGRDGRFVQ